MSKVSDEQIKLMREYTVVDDDLLNLMSRFMFELTKAVKDFEDELDLVLNHIESASLSVRANKQFVEDTKDLPM